MKFQREVPLLLEIPEFRYYTVYDKSQLVPKISSIGPPTCKL